MNIVDSSGWLEFFASGSNASVFAQPIRNVRHLLVPAITLTEVFKRVLQQKDEPSALQAVGHMLQGQVVPLSSELAIEAGRLGHLLKIPLADSLILATARLYDAVLWTQDQDFKSISGVRYIPKRSGAA